MHGRNRYADVQGSACGRTGRPAHTLSVCLALAAAMFASPGSAQFTGRVSVVDGDSLDMSGVQIRIFGIDALESAQTCRAGGRRWRCGAQASRALTRRIAGRAVACVSKDRDRYGRIVAVCRAGRVDLGAWMVANGWALAYRRHSKAYTHEERAARNERRGVWRGRFMAPWEWRRVQRRAAAGKRAAGCRIKGNIGAGGARIYHVPGGRSYDRTRINTARGERWFCTESEARRAGWRRARR